MPRTSIWFNPEQLAEVRDTFGDGANLSGVVRAALAVLMTQVRRDPAGSVAMLTAATAAVQDAREQLDAARAELEATASRRRSS